MSKSITQDMAYRQSLMKNANSVPLWYGPAGPGAPGNKILVTVAWRLQESWHKILRSAVRCATICGAMPEAFTTLEVVAMRKKPPTRQDKWRSKHMRTISTRLTKSQAERLFCACFWAGVTPYRLAQNLLLRWLRDQENAGFPS